MKFKLLESLEMDSEGNSLSEQQIEYFKNSKVRDDNGNLLVCYHGTNAEFREFKYGDGGFHFGTKSASKDRQSYKKAKDSNWRTHACYLNIMNPYVEDTDCGQWDGSSVCLVWLFGTSYDGADEFLEDGTLPEEDYIPDEFESDREEIIRIAKMWNPKEKSDLGSGSKEFQQLLKKHGYDGIKYLNVYEGSGEEYSYMIFDSNQAKLISNKNPTDSNNIDEDLVDRNDLKSKFINAWDSDTCHPAYRDKWSKDNPTAGQCAVTALVLNDLYGYDIYDTMVGRSRHFFNMDNGDNIIDLTSEQFNDKIDYSNRRKRDRKDLLRSNDVKERYELLKSRVVGGDKQ